MKIFSKTELEQAIQEYNSQAHNCYNCGLAELDNIVRLDRAQLTIITAQAACGKTTFLNYYSYLMNKKNNLKTLFISLEMQAPTLINQLSEYLTVDEILNNYSFADNSSINSIKDITDAITTTTADIIVIDPFNLLPINEINTNTIGDALRQIKQAAVTANKIVIIAAHPSKNIEYTPQHQYPTGLDIMGSANFNNIADVIIGMRRLQNNEVLFGISKLRNNIQQGKQGETCKLYFDYQTKTFTGVTTNTTIPTQTVPQTVDLKTYKPLQGSNVVSYFKNFKDPNSTKEIALIDILNNNIDIDTKSQINLMRKTATTAEQGQKIKLNLPTFTPTGTFKHRSTDGIINYNNLLSFDIDAKDNDNDVTVDQMKKIILNSCLKNYIYYIGLSCSGNGLWGLFKVDGKASDYVNHFNAMEKDFEKIGIIIDTACKDISRQRFISTDDNYYVNNNSYVYTKKYKIKEKTQTLQTPLQATTQDKQKLKDIVHDIEEQHINIIPTHQDSLQTIDTLINIMGEDGLKYWLAIRAQKPKFNEMEQVKAYQYQQQRDKYHNSFLGVIIVKYNIAKGIAKAA